MTLEAEFSKDNSPTSPHDNQSRVVSQKCVGQYLEEITSNDKCDDALLAAATARVFDEYRHAFEVLAEGAN